MNQHLSDEQIAGCIAGQAEREVAGHLASCTQCQNETDALSGAIAGFRATVDAAAPRNLAWENISAAAAKGAPAWPHRLWASPWGWALPWGIPALAALVLVAAVLLVRAPQPAATNARSAALEASREAGDEALLLQVQSAIGRPAPRALAPAQTIADERAALLVAKPTASSKNSNRRKNK